MRESGASSAAEELQWALTVSQLRHSGKSPLPRNSGCSVSSTDHSTGMTLMERDEGAKDQNDELGKKITSWLSDQGYPLEMRVAQEMRKRKIGFHQSEYYEDPETGDHREIDLVGRIRLSRSNAEFPAFLYAVIEYKSSPGKPWILFSGGSDLHPVAQIAQRFVLSTAVSRWGDFARTACENNGNPFTELPLFRVEDDPAYTVVRSSLGKSREDVAYGAMTSVSKAAYAISNENRAGAVARIAVPIIVIDSPLFTCKLDSAGNTDLRRVPMGTVVWRKQIARNSPPHSIVRIVTVSTLPDLCEELHATTKALRGIF